MGDFNANSPNPRFWEPRIYASRGFSLSGSRIAIATRIRPGASSIDAIHFRLRDVLGTPGVGVEIVNDLQPATTVTRLRPLAGATVTLLAASTWEDQAAGALGVADIDNEFDNANYATNNGGNSRNTEIGFYIDGAGTGTGQFAGRRILAVNPGATVKLRNLDDNAKEVDVRMFLRLNAANYYGPRVGIRKSGRFQAYDQLASFTNNPDQSGIFENLPWTQDRWDDVIDSADLDAYGFAVRGKLADNGIRVNCVWVDVRSCVENRVASLYRDSAPRNGWDQYDLTGPDSSGAAYAAVGAESANTWYWLVISMPFAQTKDRAFTQLVRQVGAELATVATSTTQEHRRSYELVLGEPGGVPNDLTPTGGVVNVSDEFLSFLLDDGGSILSQSQPYQEADEIGLDVTETDTHAQQITGQAQSYGSFRLPVRWMQDTPADAPLIIKLRTSSGVGTPPVGAVLATATLDPKTFPDLVASTDVQIPFNTPVTLAAVQYHVTFESDATETQGWVIPLGDTRSDDIGASTTTTEIQGTGAGAATDSYVLNGAALARFDIPVALIASPGPPTAISATTLAAT